MFRSIPLKMRHGFSVIQSLFLFFLFPALSLAVPGSDRSIQEKKQAVMKTLPGIHVPFVENRGQVGDERVMFYARTFGGTLFVTGSGEMVYSLPFREKIDGRDRKTSQSVRERKEELQTVAERGVFLKETLVGATVDTVRGQGMFTSKVSYFHGNDRSRWERDLATYETLSLGEVYTGIDLALKAAGDNVEKIFTVKPHGDPGTIRMHIEGAKSISIAANGELEVATDLGPVLFTKPVAFQEIDGRRVDVPVRYALAQGASDYGFVVTDYDNARNLVIDPLLASTYLGKQGEELALTIAVDTSGNVYVAGYSNSADFPTTTGSYDTLWNGTKDIFISKLNGDLTQLLASTYLGGSQDDEAQVISLDAAGNVYVAGDTKSMNFPTKAAVGVPFNTVKNDSDVNLTDAFVSKLSGDLTQLLASTYLGGSGNDFAYAMAMDAGNIYVVGITKSANYPTTVGAYDESNNGSNYDDVFITKLKGDLTGPLLASTFLGGSDHDRARTIALDTSKNVYVAGMTKSMDFPVTGGAYDTTRTTSDPIHPNATYEIFIAKLKADLTQLLASTYLGGNNNDDVAYSLVLDGEDNVYVAGITFSADYPTTSGAYDTSFNGYQDAVISKLDSNLTQLLASTYLGGSSTANSMALDVAGNIYVTGYTGPIGEFPTTSGAYDTSFNGGYPGFIFDAFIAKFKGDLSMLLSSTFLGGTGDDYASAIVVDASRNVYVTGWTRSTTFPTTSGAYDTLYNGYFDAFISRFDKTLRKLDPKGDVDKNDIVNLADAILAIQVSSGMSSTKITLDADVNVDDRIGLAEVIYILQKVAGMR